MRADVCRPNVVLGVHSYRVSGHKEIIGDAAKEFPVSVKLHQRMFAAVKDVDMTLGIYCHTSDLNEVFARRQLKEIEDRFVVELGNRFLTKAGKNANCTEQRDQDRQS